MSRVLVTWCPDWPVVAALAALSGQLGGQLEGTRHERLPAGVFAANIVQACNDAARSFGVRRGMRRRDAQSRCPELLVLEADPDRDARAFETVLATLEELRPGVAPLRPGLAALHVPPRYYGGEEETAAVFAERLVEAGVWDCRFGVADELFTAEQAARRADVQACRVIGAGESSGFLRQLPVAVLDDPDTVGLMHRLGLRSLGQVADLPAPDVRARFGARTAWVHRVVSGDGAQLLPTRTPPPELTVQVDFEPPLESAETVCFSTRRTAEAFVAQLAERQLVCTALCLEVYVEGLPSEGAVSVRTWLHPRFFGSTDIIDRLHWQLQGSLKVGEVRAPVTRVRLVPEAVVSEAVHADGLWGGTDEQVERGVARVQGLLGHEAVVVPVLQGGRGPADRQALVPWGERPVGLRPAGLPWPGSIPPPAPTRVLMPPWPAAVVGPSGQPVVVDPRGTVDMPLAHFRSAPPGARAEFQPVASWAGPWPVDEGWWEPGGRQLARFQVVGVDGRAWLVLHEAGAWFAEALYD